MSLLIARADHAACWLITETGASLGRHCAQPALAPSCVGWPLGEYGLRGLVLPASGLDVPAGNPQAADCAPKGLADTDRTESSRGISCDAGRDVGTW